MIRLLPLVLIAGFLAATLSCNAPRSVSEIRPGSDKAPLWLQHPTWDEGLAEVTLYDGTQIKYGITRPTSLEIITVREHFDPAKLVKTSPAADKATLPIMKVNLTRRTRTGVYEYLQMASVFQHRDTADLVKASVVSAEWCGNSHVLIEPTEASSDAPLQVRISNYFDDGGTSTASLPAGVRLHEELIPFLRQHLRDLSPGDTLEVARPFLSNKPALAIDTVRIDTIENGIVTLAFPGHRETFEFDGTQSLAPLKAWRHSNGDTLTLRKRTFMDYWNKTRPGDERSIR